MTAQLLRFGATIGPGEERTAQLLARGLPDDWTIVCNKVVQTGSRSSREIDFVVVGRHGVYVMDEKSWSGTITADEGHWTLQSGEEIQPPDAKAAVTASIVAVQMKQSLPGLRRHIGGRYFLWGYVLLSSPRASLATRNDSLYDRVLYLKDAAKTLMDQDASYAGGLTDIEAFRPDIIDWFGRPPELAAMSGAGATRGSGRKRWGVVAAVVAVAILAVAGAVWASSRGESDAQIPWQEASQSIGKSVTVRGPVMGSSDGFKYVFLNIGEPYVEGEATGLVVWLDIESLDQSASELQAAYPTDSLVTVEGVVGRDGDGRPKIVVTDLDSISRD